MDKYIKVVLAVACLLSLAGCQDAEELYSNEALYDHVCREVINDVSRYPGRIEILGTSIFEQPVSEESASTRLDSEIFELLKSFRGYDGFTGVYVSYRLLENGQSNTWACSFVGLKNRGHMQMNAFHDGFREYKQTDEYYFFKSGATHTDVFGFIKHDEISFFDKAGFWFTSLLKQ